MYNSVHLALQNAVQDMYKRRIISACVENVDVWYKALNDASHRSDYTDLIDLIVAAMEEIEKLKKQLGDARSKNVQ